MQATPASQSLRENSAAPVVASEGDAQVPSGSEVPLTYRSEGFAEDLDTSRLQPWRPPAARRTWKRWLFVALAVALGVLAGAVALARHRLW
jgi:hypothetical protein